MGRSAKRGVWIACLALALIACFVALFRTIERADALAPSEASSESQRPQPLTRLATPAERVTDPGPSAQPGPASAREPTQPAAPHAERRVTLRGLLVRTSDATFERADFELVSIVVLRPDENGLERTFAAHAGEASFTEVDLSAGIRQPTSGRFEALVDLPEPLESGRAELVLIISFGNHLVRERAFAELPSELPDEIDLGVVPLVEPRELARGHVRDDQGRPLRGITVTAAPRFETVEHDRFRFGGWSAGISGADGAFTVRGWILGDVFDVRARQSSFSANQIWKEARLENVPVGARDLTLVLHPNDAASIAGRVLVDDPDMLSALQIALDGEVKQSSLHRPEFTLRPVASGHHTLRIQRECDRSELLTLERLEVREGEACTDPRLDPIDLRGKLHWLEARLENADGTPYGNIQVHTRYASGAVLNLMSEWDGRLRLLYMGEAPKLEIITPSRSYVPFDPGALVRME